VRVGELVGRRRRLRQDAEPGERVLPEEVRAHLAVRDEGPGVRAGPSQPATKSHPISWLPVSSVNRIRGLPSRSSTLTSLTPEAQVAAVRKAPGDEVLEHLVLRVHGDRPATGQLVEVDPAQLTAEGEVDAVVDEAVAV
jgi:hypothetical protein